MINSHCIIIITHISYIQSHIQSMERCIAYLSTHKLATHCIQSINQTINQSINHFNHTQYPALLYLEFSILGLVFKTRQIHNPNLNKTKRKKED